MMADFGRGAAAMAAGLRHLPGLVVFEDPCGQGRWSGEWVAAEPDMVARGTWPRETPPAAAEGEFWAGTMDYDGGWEFARYPRWLHRGSGGWAGAGGLEREWKEPPSSAGFPAPARMVAGMEKEAFMEMVARAKEYIAAGDIYQVNLAHAFAAEWAEAVDAWALYRAFAGDFPGSAHRLSVAVRPGRGERLAGDVFFDGGQADGDAAHQGDQATGERSGGGRAAAP